MTITEGQDLLERREIIRQLVLKDGYARIEDLVSQLGVSLMTVHRDLDALSHQGYLTKIRGGATANPSALLEARVPERISQGKELKTAIAAHAAKLLTPGQTVFLDDSTTAMAMAPHLIAASPITVATNFLPLISKLAGVAGIELFVIGGQYYPVPEACFGSRTIDTIKHLRADLAIMSTTGISALSCYHRSEMTVDTRKAFMQNSAASVLLTDHAKFGRPALHLLCRLSDFDLVITDNGIDTEDRAELDAAGIKLEVAGS